MTVLEKQAVLQEQASSEKQYSAKVNPISLQKAAIALAIIVIVVIALMLTPIHGLSFNGKKALAITVFAIVLWVFEVIPVEITSILLPVLYVIFKVVNPPVAFSGFANPVTWFIYIALIYGLVLQITGLGKRIAIGILKCTGTSFIGAMIGIMFAGLVLAFITPAGVERIIILFAIVIGLPGAFGMTDQEFRKSNACKFGMGVVFLAANIIGLGILTSIAPNIIAQGMIKETLNINVTWMQWLIWLEVPMFVVSVISVFFLYLIYRPEPLKVGENYAREEMKKLGPMAGREKRAALYFILSLILWMTGSVTHLAPWAVGALIAVLFVAPRIGVIEAKDLMRAPVRVVIFSGAAITTGSVLLKVGVGDWLGQSVLGPLVNTSMSKPIVAIITFLVSAVSHVFFIEGTTISGAMVPIVAHYYSSIGVYALGPALMVAISSGSVGFFAVMQLPMLLLVGYGYLSYKDAAKILTTITVVTIFVLSVASFTWFHWLRLL